MKPPVGDGPNVESGAAELAPLEPTERERELAGVLHEVSNAMTVVLGWLEAADGQLANGPVKDAVAIARSHARIGHAAARRAIGAEAPVSARHELDREARSVARDATLGVLREATRNGVELRVDDSRVDNCAVFSPVAVQQILTNLLLNAIAFSPEAGLVNLDVIGDGSDVVFAVSDEGPGVPPELRERIFDGQVSLRDGGAGIGLTHSFEVARNHGGRLSLGDSLIGARFELRWPVGEVRSAIRHRSIPPASLAGRRVLVLEDDPAIVSLLELALESRGARVLAARSAAELSGLRSQAFDAALVDLSPLGDDPARWIHDLKQTYPGLPVVMITGSALDVPGLSGDEVMTWVRKPFEVSEVLDALSCIE